MGAGNTLLCGQQNSRSPVIIDFDRALRKEDLAKLMGRSRTGQITPLADFEFYKVKDYSALALQLGQMAGSVMQKCAKACSLDQEKFS